MLPYSGHFIPFRTRGEERCQETGSLDKHGMWDTQAPQIDSAQIAFCFAIFFFFFFFFQKKTKMQKKIISFTQCYHCRCHSVNFFVNCELMNFIQKVNPQAYSVYIYCNDATNVDIIQWSVCGQWALMTPWGWEDDPERWPLLTCPSSIVHLRPICHQLVTSSSGGSTLFKIALS